MEILGVREGWHRRNVNLIKVSPVFFREDLGKCKASPHIT